MNMDRPAAKDRLEADVLKIVHEVLEDLSIDPDDDLRTHGLDSLASVELVTQLEDLTGTDLSEAVLASAPTVSSLITAARESNS